MKKYLIALFFASVVAVSAQSLVTGVEVGYLTDADEPYTTARIGWQFKTDEIQAHEIGVEIGHVRDTMAGGKAKLTPFTVNYRLTSATPGEVGYHLGLGAGFARVGADGVSIGGPVTLRDTTFAAQAFTGLTWQTSASVTLTVGAKYIWIDDVRLAGTPVKMGDDLALTAGLSFRF